MGWTKRDFVKQAFEEIGYASYIYDAVPEELESILRTLDAMMATWNAKGIRIGYPASSTANGASLDEQTDVPDAANEAIYLALAIRIAPRFGKQVQQETKQNAKDAYDALLNRLAQPIEMQFNQTVPAGAGNKYLKKPMLNKPVDKLAAGKDNLIDFT